MITRLEIENFKAIRKVAIDLTPLTVFVGPNDAGKTTILQALDVLGRSVRGAERIPLHEVGRPSVFARDPIEYFPGQERGLRMLLAASGPTDSGRPFRHELAVSWKNADYQVNRHVESDPAAGLASFYVCFDPSRLASPSSPGAELTSRGDGLPGLVKRLLTSLDRRPLERMEAQLRRISRFVRGVATRTRADGSEELWFATADGSGFPAHEASTGLVLVTAYLALAHGTTHRTFLIEEPENGIHPLAILMVVDMLRELARDGRQVIATTHSPVLLDYMDPADVQVVTRDQEGVHVTPILKSRFFDEGTQRPDLGELWYSVGDEAIVSTAS